MRHTQLVLFLIAASTMGLVGCTGIGDAAKGSIASNQSITPSPVPSPSPTPTPSPNPSPNPSPTPIPTPQPTPTPTPTPGPTPTPTPTPQPSPGIVKVVNPPSVSGATDTVMINYNTVLANVPADYLGVNVVGFWDSTPLTTNSQKAFQAAGFKVFRFPGGVPSNWYDWSATTTCNQGAPTPLQAWNFAKGAGASILFQTNITRQIADSTCAPNDPGGAHTAGWVTYAKNQSMNAPYWEIGNEPELETATFPDVTQYNAVFDAQAKAMHAANPNIQVYGPATTNIWYWGNFMWQGALWGVGNLGKFLASAGNRQGTGQVDGISIHWYPDSNSWDQIQNVASDFFYDGINDLYAKMFQYDTRALPIMISEISMSNSSSDPMMPQKMAAAIGTAEVLGVLARAGISHLEWFCGRGAIQDQGYGSWGLLSSDASTPDKATAAYYSFVLFSKMGPQALDHSQGQTTANLAIYSTKKSDGSVQIMAINKTASTMSQKFVINGFNPSGSYGVTTHTLKPTSGDYNSTNFSYNGTSNPLSPWNGIPAAPAAATYTSGMTFSIPAYSVVVFEIAPK